MTLKVVFPRHDQKRRGNAMEILEGKKILRANYSLKKSNGFFDRGQDQYSHSMK